jgi:hypothetical protein
MVKIKNISGMSIGFSGIPAFEIDEVREVSEQEAEYLLNSPYIELVEEDKKANKKFKAVESEEGKVKGVESEE